MAIAPGRQPGARLTGRLACAVSRSTLIRLCPRHGERLEAWAAQAETSPVSGLGGFAKGLRKDWAVVTAGLTVS